MSLLTRVVLLVGVAVTVGFPVGALYVALDGDGTDVVVLGAGVAGCFVGVCLVGVSLSSRTWDPY